MLVWNSELIDVMALAPGGKKNLSLCVSPQRTVGELTRVAAARFHMLGRDGSIASLQLRREGDLLPLDPQRPAGEVLADGARVIVEHAAGERLSGPPGGEEDTFRMAAAGAARETLSKDSATFLRDARQVDGE